MLATAGIDRSVVNIHFSRPAMSAVSAADAAAAGRTSRFEVDSVDFVKFRVSSSDDLQFNHMLGYISMNSEKFMKELRWKFGSTCHFIS